MCERVCVCPYHGGVQGYLFCHLVCWRRGDEATSWLGGVGVKDRVRSLRRRGEAGRKLWDSRARLKFGGACSLFDDATGELLLDPRRPPQHFTPGARLDQLPLTATNNWIGHGDSGDSLTSIYSPPQTFFVSFTLYFKLGSLSDQDNLSKTPNQHAYSHSESASLLGCCLQRPPHPQTSHLIVNEASTYQLSLGPCAGVKLHQASHSGTCPPSQSRFAFPGGRATL